LSVPQQPDLVREEKEPDAVRLDEAQFLLLFSAFFAEIQHRVLGWTNWSKVAAECRRCAAAVVDEHGAFAVSPSVGEV